MWHTLKASKLSLKPLCNLAIAITPSDNQKHLGGVGGNIASVINAGTHAIITTDNGYRAMYDFERKNHRRV
jgi:hypothetical protein